jgi:hypothetical protein
VKQQVGLQTFIVKVLIIRNTDNRPIYIKMERRVKRLATEETERERVCVRHRVAENVGRVGCKNGRWRNGPFWDNTCCMGGSLGQYLPW